MTAFIGVRSIIRPPSVSAKPEKSGPAADRHLEARTPCDARAAVTSPLVAQLATTAGRRRIAPFQMFTASSYLDSPGVETVPASPAWRSRIPSVVMFAMTPLLPTCPRTLRCPSLRLPGSDQ